MKTKHLVLTILLAACSDSSSVNLATLPELSTFVTEPSDRFLVDFDDVTRTSPYVGSDNATPHDGAHVHFENRGIIPEENSVELYPPIYAIADGTITEVSTFEDVGDYHKYEILLAFAKENGEAVEFQYSIEPLIEPTDSTFYEPFVLVTDGQEVLKGDIIAYMYIPDSSIDGGTHIHFNLRNDSKQAPVIFTPEIKTQFVDLLTDVGECMGIDLTADENPQGTGATDCL